MVRLRNTLLIYLLRFSPANEQEVVFVVVYFS